MQPPLFGALVRTRARAAEETQTLSTSTSSSFGITVSSQEAQVQTGAQQSRASQEGTYECKICSNPCNERESLGYRKYCDYRRQSSGDESVSSGFLPVMTKKGRYIVMQEMPHRSTSTFGKVVEAIDTMNQKRVAIQIICAVPKFTTLALLHCPDHRVRL